jgi:hypothetical protein
LIQVKREFDGLSIFALTNSENTYILYEERIYRNRRAKRIMLIDVLAMMAIPIILGFNLILASLFILRKKGFQANVFTINFGFGFLLGNLLLLFVIELKNDTYFFTNSDPHVIQQVLMLVRVLLCGIVAFGASTIIDSAAKNRILLKKIVVWIIPAIIFVTSCLWVGTKVPNQIQPINTCCQEVPISKWGLPYFWNFSTGDKFLGLAGDGVRFYPLEFLVDILFWLNVGIIAVFVGRRLLFGVDKSTQNS